MIDLEVPRRFRPLVGQAHQVAETVLRPISRKCDRAEHERPIELDMLASVIDGMNEGAGISGAGAAGVRRTAASADGNRNGSNLSTVLSIMEMAWETWGSCSLSRARGSATARSRRSQAMSSSPATRASGRRWRSPSRRPAWTRPPSGRLPSSTATSTSSTARRFFVTAGERADLVVVWATLDRSQGRAAIKSFVVCRDNPGLILDRLDHKLGIRAPDTATFRLENCRVPKEDLLGSPEIDARRSFAGAMQTFDNTRPLVAAMAVGLARACLEHAREALSAAGVELDADRPAQSQPAAAARLLELEADFERRGS